MNPSQDDIIASAKQKQPPKPKWDKTIANFLVKTSLGLTIGIGMSFVLFKRRTWPIALTTGFGAGMAYSESQRFKLTDFRSFNIASQ
ncbi:hypothetical protein HDV04_002963 [Boothiomyces sp. JEL0838]|nr:hypothetical protein HDV04_002963 [Boothiomyces sp. JEL0838]